MDVWRAEAKSAEDNLDATMADMLIRFQNRQAKICIVGLGYVGLPLALAASRAGFKVLGFDINNERVSKLNSGASVIKHLPKDAVFSALQSGNFFATCDFGRLGEGDVVMIAVPTPLSKQREPDLSYVINSVEEVSKTLRRGQLVILESTTYPGTTREIVRPILERTGLKSGIDFFLAFSPEREDPGNIEYSTSTIPKVVGGDGEKATRLAMSVYSQFISKVIEVSSCDVAEAVKITENVFRSVNIALVNELKVVFEKMGINVWEVINAAKTKPFGYMAFYPGPGLGGHCIPIDPFYLAWKAREYDVVARFIELAGQVNTNMPQYVVDRVAQAVDRNTSRGLNGSQILVIGLAYKKNIDDFRESPSLRLIRLMESRGAVVSYHDPYIPIIPSTREYPELKGRKSVSLDQLYRYEAVLISTDHDCIDFEYLVESSKLVVDTRNACGSRGIINPKVVLA